MKRIPALAFLLIIFCGRLYSQPGPGDSLHADGLNSLNSGKFRYGVTIGSEFMTSSGYGSAFNTIIQPRFSYGLNRRLTIGGGFSIIQTNYINARPCWSAETNPGSSGNFTSGMVFVNGSYLVNDRLTLTGSAFKQFPITRDPLPYNPFNPVSAKGAQGVDFNIGYRIGRNMYIQAGFRYTDGIDPYRYDPFDGTGYSQDPFGSNRFFTPLHTPFP